ncbi:hypothetical protein C8Q76DRAFT_688007 [Earliella scabrosa]|nr:hypothetical protein C8Q76DRAFT_688007 [Earliella scabrosa]
MYNTHTSGFCIRSAETDYAPGYDQCKDSMKSSGRQGQLQPNACYKIRGHNSAEAGEDLNQSPSDPVHLSEAASASDRKLENSQAAITFGPSLLRCSSRASEGAYGGRLRPLTRTSVGAVGWLSEICVSRREQVPPCLAVLQDLSAELSGACGSIVHQQGISASPAAALALSRPTTDPKVGLAPGAIVARLCLMQRPPDPAIILARLHPIGRTFLPNPPQGSLSYRLLRNHELLDTKRDLRPPASPSYGLMTELQHSGDFAGRDEDSHQTHR